MAGIKHKTRAAGTVINTSAVWAEDHEIEGEAIGTAAIANASVTTAKIADNAITSAKISPDCIIAEDVATGAITVVELGDNSVDTAELVDNAVTTDKILNDAVTSVKIASIPDNIVTTLKIADLNVTTAKIADAQITTPKILDGAVTSVKMTADYYISTVYKKTLVQTNDQFVFQPHIYPKALYYKGTAEKTYFGFLDTNPASFDVYIQAYNHVTKTWGSKVIVKTGVGTDGHMAPSIGVLPNGKLIVFYGAHSTTPLYYKISTNVEDESTWGNEQNFAAINLGWTYPQPCSFSDKLVLFARDSVNATQTRWLKNTSTDGSSWTGWVEIVNFGNGYAPYFVARRIPGTSKIIMSGHNIAYGPPVRRLNLYFAYSDDKGETWKNADGSSITLPIDEDQKIADTPASDNEGTLYSYPCLDEDGRPLVTAIFYDPSAVANHKNWLCQWMGPLGNVGEWNLDFMQDSLGNDLVFEWMGPEYPYYRRGRIHLLGALDSDSKIRMFRRVSGTNFQFDAYHTDPEAMSSEGCISEVVENSEASSEPYCYFEEDIVGAADRKLRARTFERTPSLIL